MIEAEVLHKRAVVLGASGFIGINLAQALVAEGHELICFDQRPCPHWPETAQAVIGDFSALPNELLDQLNDATVYHLVSSCRPSQNTESAAEELSADVVTTLRYLEATRARNLRWVFISSGGTVYGQNSTCPTVEDSPTNPICSYGLIKLTLEKYFQIYKLIHGTDFVVARVSNPYGPWQNPMGGQGVIAALVFKAMTGQPVEIWGDGENIRDYVYIEDAIQGLLSLAQHGESGDVCNVSSGEGATINELITVISHSLNTQINVKYVDARVSDVRRSVLDSNKLKKMSNWKTNFSLEAGIKKTADWISKNFSI